MIARHARPAILRQAFQDQAFVAPARLPSCRQSLIGRRIVDQDQLQAHAFLGERGADGRRDEIGRMPGRHDDGDVGLSGPHHS